MSQCQIGYIFPITFVNTAELGFLPSKKHGDKPLRDKRHMVDTIETKRPSLHNFGCQQ
jgi:hypothetical protein